MSDDLEGESQIRQRIVHNSDESEKSLPGTELEDEHVEEAFSLKGAQLEDDEDEKAPLIIAQSSVNGDSEQFSDASEGTQAAFSELDASESCSVKTTSKARSAAPPSFSKRQWLYLSWYLQEIFDFFLLFFITLFNPNSEIHHQIAAFKSNRAQRRENLFRATMSGPFPGCGGCGCN